MQEFQPVYQVAPVYPSGAARQGLAGYVVLQYTVTATGTTANITVIESSSPLFESAAIQAAERFRYIPRMVDGELVGVDGVTNRITFDLER